MLKKNLRCVHWCFQYSIRKCFFSLTDVCINPCLWVTLHWTSFQWRLQVRTVWDSRWAERRRRPACRSRCRERGRPRRGGADAGRRTDGTDRRRRVDPARFRRPVGARTTSDARVAGCWSRRRQGRGRPDGSRDAESPAVRRRRRADRRSRRPAVRLSRRCRRAGRRRPTDRRRPPRICTAHTRSYRHLISSHFISTDLISSEQNALYGTHAATGWRFSAVVASFVWTKLLNVEPG